MRRHYGRITTTGRDIVVVFRQITDENGNVTDPNNCLVVDLEGLEQPFASEVGQLVDSQLAQSRADLHTILFNNETLQGENILLKLHALGKLEKEHTTNVQMLVDTPKAMLLSVLNENLSYVGKGAGAGIPGTAEVPVPGQSMEDAAKDAEMIEAATTRDPAEEAVYLLDEAAFLRRQADEAEAKAEQLRPGIVAEMSATAPVAKDAASNKAPPAAAVKDKAVTKSRSGSRSKPASGAPATKAPAKPRRTAPRRKAATANAAK